jgi:hypothetical protein
MNTGRFTGLLGATALVLAQGPAVACGDKLSMIAGGVSFEVVNQTHYRGNVVLFIAPDSPLHSTKSEKGLQKSLERAGHTVRVVRTPADLGSALQAGDVDIVLTDTDGSVATPRDVALDSKAAAVPASLAIMYRPSPADFAATKVAYACVAPIDDRQDRLLIRAVENVLAAKGKGLTTTCAPASTTSST